MRRGFLLGVLAAIVGEVILAAAVVASGIVDVAATRHGALDRVLAWASTRSIAHHASDVRNPLAGDPGAARRGLEHYRDDCLACHGAPGVHPREFAAGLHPPPPDLASSQVQAFTDGMLYRTISRGIGSTGMPAFAPASPPDEIWSVVAFLRHLPALTAEERQALAEEAPRPRSARGARTPQAEAPTAGPGQQVHTVRITGFKFVPETLEVRAGDVIEFRNEDFAAHTATADDRSFDTGPIDTGASKRVLVRKKGRSGYFCRYHLAMKGTVVVQ